MLTFHDTSTSRDITVAPDAASLPSEVNWIDAFQPDSGEIAFLQRVVGVEAPSFEKMSEIENSSRLSTAGGHLFLTTPMIYHDDAGSIQTTPLGFVLDKQNVLTVRFKPVRACDRSQSAGSAGDHPLPGGPGGFVAVLDAIVDHLADELEALAGELDKLSHIIFRDEDHRPKREVGGDSRDLRQVLRNVGRAGAVTSRISETLLGISRMIPYVVTGAADFLSAEARARLKSLSRDVASLNDYEKHQSDKIQFLLDATLGMINVDQNNIFKVLTLVSVVGIPPTLIASMYGMNFKYMPELEWTYGYPYGLCLIALSAIVPLVWFKWRGWW
ncbi:magnesium transporter CorA family protein [Methylocapsa sp. S129]|uniref:magnesium transporter CorA family protein n=1 Tax=Methylocapsa sp. S129 TaxID=1641869 RepID=UPI00131DC982|nr:magnesium transporter CorA family protein [Methylocapsa sp. S129]